MSDISGIFAGDLVIKTLLELSLNDIRKNIWIVEDIFSSLVENPFLKKTYGMKEIQRAKEFIMNNNIPVYLYGRIDKYEFPCISVHIGESIEDKDLATLGDLSFEVQDYTSDQINTPIKYIIPPFDIVSYDKNTGIVEVPADIYAYTYISQGMVAVEPNTGHGFIINGKAGINGFQIPVGSELSSSTIGIIPQYQLYRARRERAVSHETYNIGCHAEGDPSYLIFLYGIVKYSLYRYREALLEYNNFQLSKISSSDIIKNESFNIENVYSRFITLSGQVEESWIKSPTRFIEAIDIADVQGTGEDQFIDQGIKILSQDAPAEYDTTDDLWTTVDDVVDDIE